MFVYVCLCLLEFACGSLEHECVSESEPERKIERCLHLCACVCENF